MVVSEEGLGVDLARHRVQAHLVAVSLDLQQALLAHQTGLAHQVLVDLGQQGHLLSVLALALQRHCLLNQVPESAQSAYLDQTACQARHLFTHLVRPVPHDLFVV